MHTNTSIGASNGEQIFRPRCAQYSSSLRDREMEDVLRLF